MKMKGEKGEKDMRKCGNCRYRMDDYGGAWMPEACMGYEMAVNEAEEIETAKGCERYEEGTPACMEEDDDYCPSATAGDYGPSNPWDAPGMSIRDFI